MALRAKLSAPGDRSGATPAPAEEPAAAAADGLATAYVARYSPDVGAGAGQWEASRFGHLEEYLHRTLTAEERVTPPPARASH